VVAYEVEKKNLEIQLLSLEKETNIYNNHVKDLTVSVSKELANSRISVSGPYFLKEEFDDIFKKMSSELLNTKKAVNTTIASSTS
jgi:hypothetical protein